MTTQPHGGPRQGVQGRAYPNRTDLMQGPRTAGTPAAGPEPVQPQRRGFVQPDQVPNLTAPSADPRPLTDGLPVGPGRGPEALTPGPDLSSDRTMMTLQFLYEQTGSQYLLRLMNRHKGIQMAQRIAP